MIIPLGMNDTNQEAEDRRALYQDAGEWSRHYSTVRMTVATFVITTCVAIIALTTDKGTTSSRVGDSVTLLWLLGLFIFYAFTFLTFKERNKQLTHRRAFAVPIPANKQGKKGASILRDPASWALLFLNTAFAIAAHKATGHLTFVSNGALAKALWVVSGLIALFIVLAGIFGRLK